MEASLNRVRPLLMTTATTVFGLMPIFLTQGRGSDVMQPMAIPMIGGMAVQLITLLLAPCLYSLVMERKVRPASPP
jgi:Cu(I)/Ag(I) efflux system membrane protein CusA/SilA